MFCKRTMQGKDSHPIYSRPNDGRTVTVRNYDLDTRWVIPYNTCLQSLIFILMSEYIP